MTRDEARKKAEEVADCYDYKKEHDASVKAFMACYDWMISEGLVIEDKTEDKVDGKN